jgi:hypothetical protein
MKANSKAIGRHFPYEKSCAILIPSVAIFIETPNLSFA